MCMKIYFYKKLKPNGMSLMNLSNLSNVFTILIRENSYFSIDIITLDIIIDIL